MTIRIQLFGQLAQAAGAPHVDLSVADSVTCGTLRAQLASDAPCLAPYLHLCVLAVNHEYGSESTAVIDTDEVALIGLVSGG